MRKKTIAVTVCASLPPTGVGAQHNPNGGGVIIEIYHTSPPTEATRGIGTTKTNTPKMSKKKKK